MSIWYDVVEPHQDIKDGNFDEAIFAADLGNVALGNAPMDYNEPAMFFKKTYFTEGIINLLVMVNNKLEHGKGSSVVQIQTPFGGGKTHALISIYHYLKNGSKVKSHLPNGLKPTKAKISVIVGTHLNPLEGHKRDGLDIKTLWGEIAFQLGGKEGYKQFEKNDQERVSPGKEKLSKFFDEVGPFIILCDEVLQYISKAQGVKYHDTSLGSQTFAFFQELTESVASSKNGMLIVTLPSSYIEDYTEKSEESLATLNKIFGRIETIETPVKGEEIYSIIRSRLFDEVKNEIAKEAIIADYFTLYQKHKEDLPAKARDIDYKRKMELSYPFHPEVIDILYEKWGTFSSFQRTRGVLRLLANVVDDLYNKEKNIDIILPSDIGLDSPAVRQEFLKHIGSEYESIVGSDISGHEAKSMSLDKENRGWNHLAERISTCIFFYSFSGDKSDKGATLERIKFSTMHKDTIPAMVTDVLHQLDKALWYLNEKGNMYRFSKIPNLNRMILDKKELYNITYKEEMKTILNKEVGNAFISYLWPKKSEDIPDNKDVKLAILSPSEKEDAPNEWLEKRGNTFRTYKNTLIFAVSDPNGFGHFKEEIKTYLALKEIQSEIKGDEGGLSDRAEEVANRIKKIKDDFSYNARRMYNTLIVGGEKVSLGQPTVGKESMSNWYKMELESSEKLAPNIHFRYIVDKFIFGKEKIDTKVIIEQFYKDTNLVIPESAEVIRRSIQKGILEGAFGLGYEEGETVDNETFKFKSNISTTSISLDEGEIIISNTQASVIQSKIDGQEETPEPDEDKPDDEDKGDDGGGGDDGDSGPKRYKKLSLRIEGIPSSKIADLNRGVLMPLSREVGGFSFNMEIEIDNSEGVSELTLKNKVKETISQIGAKVTKEEKE